MNGFNWYIQQDELSVHVGINHRISLIYQQKMIPSLIRLGKKHTRLFGKSAGTGISPGIVLSLIWAILSECRRKAAIATKAGYLYLCGLMILPFTALSLKVSLRLNQYKAHKHAGNSDERARPLSLLPARGSLLFFL